MINRRRIRRISSKTQARNAEYSKARGPFLAANPWCVAFGRFPEAGCTRRATEVHHAKGRIGRFLLDQRWWQALCSNCHRWATEHPQDAYDAGISFHRNAIDDDGDEETDGEA